MEFSRKYTNREARCIAMRYSLAAFRYRKMAHKSADPDRKRYLTALSQNWVKRSNTWFHYASGTGCGV